MSEHEGSSQQPDTTGPPPGSEDETTPPEGIDRPTAAAGTEQPQRIWDPDQGRWVTPAELEGRQPAPTTSDAPPAPAARPAVPGTGGGMLGPLIAGIAGAVLAIVVMLFVPGLANRESNEPRTERNETAPAVDPQAITELVRPAVVNVVAQGLPGDTPQRTGSGIMLRSEGGIVATSARLVDGAQDVTVTFSSGRAVPGDLLGVDLATDVAIISVGGDDHDAISRGTVEFLGLGQPLVAVSSPAETYALVTTGVVSSVARPVRTQDGELLFDMVQMDAPLPSAGAGGAVVMEGGSVVGLTSPVTEEGSGGASGFFVPIDVVEHVAEAFVNEQEPVNPWIGTIVTPVDESTGLPVEARGFVVAIIFEDGPAAEAGVGASDIIIGIDGEPIEGTLSLLTALLDKRPGDEIGLTIWSQDGTEDVTVTVEDRPDEL